MISVMKFLTKFKNLEKAEIFFTSGNAIFLTQLQPCGLCFVSRQLTLGGGGGSGAHDGCQK